MLKLFKVLLSGCLAIALLSIFCFGYSYNMIHLEEESGATDCISVPGSYVAEMEEGIAWNKIDAYGNNNKRTYDLVDILMMGGSNIEAIHLSKKDNVTYLLDEDLKDYNVYSIGQSGHDIYTCVQNLENACEKYTPKYVVMDISKEKLDIESMKMVLGGASIRIQKSKKE